MGVSHPPAKCRSCGKVHPATAFAMENSFGISFSGCQVACPFCGSISDVLDGTYDFYGDVVKLLSGPESTISVLKQLAQTVKDSVAAGESAEKTVERITEIAPWLNGIRNFAKGQVVSLVWAALGAIAGYEYTQYRDGLTAADRREQQVMVVREGLQLDREAQQWQEFQARMNEQLPEPPHATNANRYSLASEPGPLIREAPHTMARLSEYMKQSHRRSK